jgi:hypothetical protein
MRREERHGGIENAMACVLRGGKMRQPNPLGNRLSRSGFREPVRDRLGHPASLNIFGPIKYSDNLDSSIEYSM